jgi:hypothetical protein
MYFARDGETVYGFYGWREFENFTGRPRNATNAKYLVEAIRRKFPRAEIANTKAALSKSWINEKRRVRQPFVAGNIWHEDALNEMPLL